MTPLEKKLCTALDELITEVLDVRPGLRPPLQKIQRVLREMAG